MTHEVNSSNAIDHRHPELASIALKIVGTATYAADHSASALRECVDAATQALYSSDSGEHRDVAVLAISKLAGTSPELLFASYDAPADPCAPRTLKLLTDYVGTPEYDFENLSGAIVRFEACHHVNLVKKFICQFVSKQDPKTFNHVADELFAYGYIGLSNALRSYDPTNNTISTFAHFRIVGAVRDGIRAESPVPKRLTTFVRAVESAEETLTQALSRIPTQEEVVEVLGDQAKYMHLYPRLCRQASLDEMTNYNPVSDDDVAATVALDSATCDLQAEIGGLDELERAAVQLMHAEGLSARMAAREVGVTQSAMSKAAESGLAKLRQSPRLQQWQGLVAA